MPIQWFPGHMHKARLEMQKVLPKVDMVVEVLDARIPYSSENPLLAELLGEKPCLKVLAKSDLADQSRTNDWLDHLHQATNVRARAVSTEDVPTIRRLKSVISQISTHREGTMITAMIVGIPNVGKSTIINLLAGKKVAKTGNTPAVTQQQQRVNIGDDVILLDTPGMLWPKVHNENSGYRLALLGSVKDTAMEYGDVGFFAARVLLAQYPDRLVRRFLLDSLPESDLELIEAIGRRRGCLGRSGLVDIDRAARILVNELRTGGLGRLTLETPAMMEQEKARTARLAAEQTVRAKKKDQQRKKKFRDQQRAKRKARGKR